MDLERACPTAAHWTEQQYSQLFPDAGVAERLVLVAQAEPGDASLSGFFVARHIAPEWELENIVVAPHSRRKGLGNRLLEALLKSASETNSDAVFLEVRESNSGARALYEQAGFQQSGLRKYYYTNPLEDAVVYRRTIKS